MKKYKYVATVTVYAETQREASKLVAEARAAFNKGDNVRLYTFELERVVNA